MGLVDADAVDAGRRVAAGQFLFAVETYVARRAGAVGAAVVGDQAGPAVVTHHRVASVELLLAEFAFESWWMRRKSSDIVPPARTDQNTKHLLNNSSGLSVKVMPFSHGTRLPEKKTIKRRKGRRGRRLLRSRERKRESKERSMAENIYPTQFFPLASRERVRHRIGSCCRGPSFSALAPIPAATWQWDQSSEP